MTPTNVSKALSAQSRCHADAETMTATQRRSHVTGRVKEQGDTTEGGLT